MNSIGGGVDAGDWPKASIGNYKGVMLCNRPNEFGMPRRTENMGLEPFNSRVDPKVPLGWNPTLKLLPKRTQKKKSKFELNQLYIGDPNSILVRHRNFLKDLETKKNQEREDIMLQEQMKELRAK
jgi:hypothetical protein